MSNGKTKLVVVVVAVLMVTNAFGQSVTRPTFLALQRVQEMMEAEQYQEALVELEALAIKTEKNAYDFALTNQYLAHVSIIQDNTARARKALEAALANEGLPPEIRTDMNLFYGTVLLGEEEFELGLKALEEWYSLATVPLPSQVFSLSYANYQNGNVARAEDLVALAIGETPEPPESWYQLYYRVLFEQKKYDHAEVVLKGMIERSPLDDTYWRMLASHFLQIEESSEGLAAMMIAYTNELVESGSDLKQIVSLWGYIDAPEKGARLLESLIASGRLEADAETLKQLGNLWLMARERQNAIGALTEAAKVAPDGKTYELIGGIYFEDEKWAAAYTAYQNAIRQGDLDEPNRVSLLAGISAFRAGNNEDARRALEIAAKDDALKSQADGILRQLD
jgi:Tfp pilus assembly protein PilF